MPSSASPPSPLSPPLTSRPHLVCLCSSGLVAVLLTDTDRHTACVALVLLAVMVTQMSALLSSSSHLPPLHSLLLTPVPSPLLHMRLLSCSCGVVGCDGGCRGVLPVLVALSSWPRPSIVCSRRQNLRLRLLQYHLGVLHLLHTLTSPLAPLHPSCPFLSCRTCTAVVCALRVACLSCAL